MKIGTKIFIILLIFFIEILILMFTFSIINRHHERVMHHQRHEMEKLDSVRSLQIALSRVVMPANDFLILGGAENEIQNFKVLSAEVETLIDKLDNVTLDDIEERELLEHVKGEYLQVKDIAIKIFSLPDALGNPEAGRLMEEMDKVADDALKDAEEFRYFVQQEMEEAHIDMMKVKNAFDLVVWVGILSNIILIFGALFFFRRTIILPIKSMKNVMLEVGKGNLERKINLKNKDEIGDLAASFNKMTDDLRNIMLLKEHSEQRLRLLIESSEDCICHISLDGNFISMNQAGAAFNELDSAEEIIGKSCTADIAENRQAVEEAVRRAAGGETVSVQYKSVGKKGKEIWWDSKLTPVRDVEGRISGILRISRDITERKHAEDELRRDYQIQRAINSLFSFSLKDVSIDELLKYTIDLPWLGFESRGAIFLIENSSDVLTMKAQTRLSEQIQNLCTQVPLGKCLCGRAALTGEIQFVDHLDERHEITYAGIYPHGHYCVPIIFAGKVIGVMNMYTVEGHRRSSKEEEALRVVANVLGNIIVRKQAEEKLKNAYNELKTTQSQLIQAEKMAVVGQLASGVAHEVKNPLAIILQGIEYLSKDVPGDDKGTSSALKYMNDAVKRADNIIKELLDLSRLSSPDLKQENLNFIIENVLLLMKHQFDEYHIRLIRDFKQDLPSVNIDKNKIEQVFVNLILNAIQAMPEGGELKVKTSIEKKTPTEIWAIAQIEDTGKGMPDDVLGKIFDPFFTTKRHLGGTGLGLSVVRNIIQMHDGKIEIKNREDRPGAIAKVMLKA